MANVRVRMNRAGVRDLLNSQIVQDLLLEHAERVKRSADAGLPKGAAAFVADVQAGKNRAHAMAKTSDAGNRAHNARTNALLKGLGA